MSDLKIFTENIEPEALNQIYMLIKQPAFAECKVRIMPDVHAGKGCVIGFTADLGDKVIPNIVGVDIGCGMLTTNLGNIDIDYGKLDSIIRENIPSGRSVRKEEIPFPGIEELYCRSELKNIEWLRCSMGSLGGGNHFIEIDEDSEENKYLIIHTGSRNLGKQVAEIYQQVAINDMQGADKLEKDIQSLIQEYKATGRAKDIERGIRGLKREYQPDKLYIPKELCYLTGENRERYLHDMKICQAFAGYNREWIASIICQNMGWKYSRGKSYQDYSQLH